jgi:signal transduction histidine kinase
MLPSSLRGRLLAAFTAIILLTLFVVGSGVLWVIQAYRTQLSVDHFSELAAMASGAGRQLERQDGRPEEIAAFVSGVVGRPDVRVLVMDPQGKVLAERPTPTDLDQYFAGRTIDVPPTSEQRVAAGGRSLLGQRTRVWTFGPFGSGRGFILVTPVLPVAQPDQQQRAEGLERFFQRQASYRIVLAVPEQSLGSAFRELFPRLLIAALVAIAAASAAAWWLARSMAHPLRQITAAAEQMARGALRQSIPEEGSQEITQLAVAFNSMSREVERSHQALKEFLANASHELRTPLTSIQGFSQALVDGALAGEEGTEEAGKIINEEANRMRLLVEDLLYLSRVESADVPATHESVDVAELLREEGRRLQFAAEQRDISIALHVPSSPCVRGDASELERLFGNLMENAVKYTPVGGSITVRAEAGDTSAVVSVHNTGSYIPIEDQPRVFERFYRVDKSRARDVEGSGLGLAIAWEIAQRHGGTIAVASDVAAGTTFSVRLPQTAGSLVGEASLTARVEGPGADVAVRAGQPAAVPV